MEEEMNRSEERRHACMHAFVTNLADTAQIKCVIRNVSNKGCMIVTNRAAELPDIVQIIPEGFDRPIRAVRAWRRDNMAGLCFEHGCDAETRQRIAQLRRLVDAHVAEPGEDLLALGHVHEPLGYTERMKRLRS